MVPCRTHTAADPVGEALGGSNVVKQAGRKSTAESFVEHRESKVIGILARDAERHHLNVALIYVGLVDLVVSRLGWFELDFWIGRRRAQGPRREGLAQTRLHLRRIKVADHAENNIVGVDVLAVPLDQILARDRRHGCIFGLAGIGIIRAIREFGCFPSCNLRGIVVAARDAVVHPLLRDFNLVGAELRISQQVGEHLKHVVEIFFQARPTYGCRIGASAGLDLGCALFEIVVELISGLGLGAAGAPHFAVDVHQPGLVCRNRALAAANASRAVDHRQFVVFLKKNHHAIRQLDSFRLLRVKCRQLRNRYLLPRLRRRLLRLRA